MLTMGESNLSDIAHVQLHDCNKYSLKRESNVIYPLIKALQILPTLVDDILQKKRTTK